MNCVCTLKSYNYWLLVIISISRLLTSSCLPPQRVSVTLKEHFRRFVTSGRVPACVSRTSPGFAVTSAGEDTAIPSLPVRCVPPASSLWTNRDRTSASLWRDCFPPSLLGLQEPLILTGWVLASWLWNPDWPWSGSLFPLHPVLLRRWIMLCLCWTSSG